MVPLNANRQSKNQAGVTLIEALMSVAILGISCFQIMQMSVDLQLEGKMFEASNMIKKFSRVITPALSRHFQEYHRYLLDHDCSLYDSKNQTVYYATSNFNNGAETMIAGMIEIPRWAVTLPPDFKNEEITRVWNRCQTPFANVPNYNYSDLSTFYRCFIFEEGNSGWSPKAVDTKLLIEAKVQFWDYSNNKEQKCKEGAAQLGRGIQVLYTAYAFKRITDPSKGPDYSYYATSKYSEFFTVPKAIFKENKTLTDMETTQ